MISKGLCGAILLLHFQLAKQVLGSCHTFFSALSIPGETCSFSIYIIYLAGSKMGLLTLHVMYVEVRGQFLGICFLLLLHFGPRDQTQVVSWETSAFTY